MQQPRSDPGSPVSELRLFTVNYSIVCIHSFIQEIFVEFRFKWARHCSKRQEYSDEEDKISAPTERETQLAADE